MGQAGVAEGDQCVGQRGLFAGHDSIGYKIAVGAPGG